MSPNSNSHLKSSRIAILGALLTAVAIGAGVWLGSNEASKLNADKPNSPEKLSDASAIGAGEVILPQRRMFARPPDIFDPVAALAASATTTASLTATAAPLTPKSTTVDNAPTVSAVGWAGAGSPLQQMWDGGNQANWTVRPVRLSAPNWRINGVVQRGKDTQVIVQFEGDPTPKFYKLGDTLPGGAKLAWVKPDVIGVVMPKNTNLSVPVLDGQAQSYAGTTTLAKPVSTP
jgi:hypothetical protein